MTETSNPNLPEEMNEALRSIVKEARDLISDVTAAMETANKWLEGEPAFDFHFSGSYARDAGDLEAAIATFRAYRNIAHKLGGIK